ncbi:MAG: hypothetical protein V1676_00880 [Candidatus Diapherotrites archaeon]
MIATVLQYPWDFLRPLADAANGFDLYIKLLVFILSLAMLSVALLAMRKKGSARLTFVALAFFFFALKWGIKIIDMYISPGSFLADPAENVFELAILATLFFAIFRK